MQIDSQLIEDFLATDTVLVDKSSPSPLAVFTNGNGDCEALIVHLQDQQVFHVAREPRSPTGWNLIGLGAGLSRLAPVNVTTAWAVGNDDAIWRIQNGLWTQIEGALPSGVKANGISTDRSGTAWASADDGNVYQYSAAGVWQVVDGLTYALPPRGFPGNLWTVNVDGQVLHNTGAGWQVGAPGAPNGVISDLQVDLDGNVWITDPYNNLYQLVNEGAGVQPQWQQASSVANLQYIAPVSSKSMWAMVGTNDEYTLYQLVSGTWQPVSGAPAMTSQGNISVGSDGTLWLIDANGYAYQYDAASSTFDRKMMPSGMSTGEWNISEIATGRDPSGSRYAFFVDTSSGSPLLCMSTQTSDGSWSAPQPVYYVQNPFLPLTQVTCTNIGVTNQQSDGALIVYGAQPNGDLVIVRSDGSAYTGTGFVIQSQWSFAGAKLQVSALDPQNWWTFTVLGTTLYASCGPADNPLNAADWNNNEGVISALGTTSGGTSTGPAVSTLVSLPVVGSEQTSYVAAIGTDGTLWIVTNLQMKMFAWGTWQQLTNVSGSPLNKVGMAAGVAQPDGSIRLYACENSSTGVNRLWVKRQKGTTVDSNGVFDWTSWTPLGGDYLLLANGPGSLANSELFTVGRDASLTHLSQNIGTQASPGTMMWRATRIKHVAGAEPDYVTQYKTEVTVYDENGCPAGNIVYDQNGIAKNVGIPVTIAADEAVALWVNGAAYQVEVGQPITVPTNAAGKLTVSTIAFGLHTPHLTFSADNLPDVPPVYAPQHVHDYLAGTGQLPGLGPLDTTNGPTTLQQAQVYTSPRWNGVAPTPLSPNLDANTATAAVQAFNDGFSIPVSNTGQNAQPANTAIVNTQGKRTVKVFATRSEKEAYLRTAAQAPGDSWSDFWQDVENFGTDVYQAMQGAAMQITSVAVDVKSQVVTFTVKFLGDAEQAGEQFISFVVQTYHDLANLAHAVFVMIEVAIDDAINWLKALFAWHDIANTQQVFEHYVGQAIPYLQNIVLQSDKLVTGFFESLQTDVKTQFGNVVQSLGTKTLSDFVSGDYSATQMRGSRRAAAPRAISGFDASSFLQGAQHNWLFEKALPALMGTQATTIPNAPNFQPVLDTFISNMQTAGDDLQNAYTELQNWVTNTIQQAGDFKNVALTDLLNAMEHLVMAALQFADALIQFFLGLLNAVLTVADSALKTPLDIPIVSSIYNKITGENLTFLGCFTLLAALPITVAYKAANGVNAQLFTDDMVSYITAQSVPTAAGTRKKGPSAAPGDVVSDIQTAVNYTSAGLAAIWSLMDTALDANPDVDLTAFTMADIIFPIAGQMLGWPAPIPLEEIPLSTKTEGFTFGNWLVGWVMPVADIGMMVASEMELKGKLMRYLDPAGKIFETGVGALSLALGATASGLGQADGSLDGGDIASNILGPMPDVFAFFRLDSLEDLSEGILPAVKLLIDFFTGEGCAAAIAAS